MHELLVVVGHDVHTAPVEDGIDVHLFGGVHLLQMAFTALVLFGQVFLPLDFFCIHENSLVSTLRLRYPSIFILDLKELFVLSKQLILQGSLLPVLDPYLGRDIEQAQHLEYVFVHGTLSV